MVSYPKFSSNPENIVLIHKNKRKYGEKQEKNSKGKIEVVEKFIKSTTSAILFSLYK